jgi:tetratricopeptide (TPR) repeat protein
MLMRCWSFLCSAWLLAIAGHSSVLAGGASTVPSSQPAAFFLSGIEPQALPDDAMGLIAQRWGGLFPHIPFDQAGFNVVSLPFQYDDAEHLGDPAEAQAFAFLLSNDLDWAPGCYCARHAYFVFKESPFDIKALVGNYDLNVVAQLVKYWRGTHALGGTLARSRNGYTAHVVIYEKNAKVVWEKQYLNVQSYWTLLGTVDADVLTFLGEKPNDALAAYLCMPRCKHMESLVEMGNAAFLGRLSNEEFAVYEDILNKDPDFADVRHWWANQKGWADGDLKKESREQILTLRTRLNPDDLMYFHGTIGEFAPWVADIRRLCGEDHPLTLDAELCQALSQPNKSSDVLARALEGAARWPNADYLLSTLQRAYSIYQIAGNDQDMVAGLRLASVQNLYEPGLGKETAITPLANSMIALGQYHIAADLLINHVEPTPDTEADIIWCLEQMGQFQVALFCFDHFTGNVEDQYYLLPDAVFLAAMCDRRDVLADILQNHTDYLQKTGGRDVVEWFLARMDGKPASGAPPSRSKMTNDPFGVDRLVIQFEEDMRDAGRTGLAPLKEKLQQFPNLRLGWIMKDGYERKSPDKDAADFYQAMQWLYGDDPWGQSAVLDWHIRSEHFDIKPSDPQQTLAAIKELNAQTDKSLATANVMNVSEPAPWVVAGDAKRLVDGRKFAEARELAAQYRDLANRKEQGVVSAFANHLLHLIDSAQHPGVHD